MVYVASLTASDLVDRIVDHAGGAERWDSLGEFQLRVRAEGLAFRLMDQVDAVAEMEQVVQVHEPRAELTSLSAPGWRGRLDAGRASMLDAGGAALVEREPALVPRRAPWPEKGWDDLAALTFCAYACWNYVTFPVLLRRPDMRLESIGERRIAGESLHGLRLRFPDGVPTHSPVQVFWVTAGGALLRHDYTARMVSPFAKAANRCLSETTAFGVTLPDHRLVTPLLPRRRAARAPVLVDVTIEIVEARDR